MTNLNQVEQSGQSATNKQTKQSYSSVTRLVNQHQPQQPLKQLAQFRQSLVAAVYIDQSVRDSFASSFIISGLPISPSHSDRCRIDIARQTIVAQLRALVWSVNPPLDHRQQIRRELMEYWGRLQYQFICINIERCSSYVFEMCLNEFNVDVNVINTKRLGKSLSSLIIITNCNRATFSQRKNYWTCTTDHLISSSVATFNSSFHSR